MKKSLYIAVAILTLSVFAAPAKKKAPLAINEVSQVIVIEKNHLKGADKRLKLLMKKIELLESKSTAKSQKTLAALKLKRNKILFWKKYRNYMNGRIEILRSNTREPYKEISKLDRKFGPLINNYTKLTGEAFPKAFFQKAKAVEMKLIAKMKKAK